MQQFSNQEIAELKSRIDQIQELLANRSDDASRPATRVGADPRAVRSPAGPRPALVDQLAFSIQARRMRRSHFGSGELSGPSWDMMLDLMLANTHGRALSASDLATGAAVPLSSGLRMISALERLGLVSRSIDERDRRRTIVRLTDSGTERMASYFETIGTAWESSRTMGA
ncbi:MAG: winged helix DNA-binding protein [Sphingopyxis sp.]|nr:winged helix DNA-binding protein [Sphingopyxis sp.]